jgi:hypothetical protein
MKLDWAILSNSAEVQGGLSYVLGGGWDTGFRPTFPAPFLGAITLRVLVHPTEIEVPHNLELQFWNEDGRPFAPPVSLTLHPGAVPDQHPVGWDVPATVAIGLQNLPIPAAGRYSIEILIDGQHHRSISFRMQQGQQPAAPPAPPA